MTTFSKSLLSSVNASLEYNATENIMHYNDIINNTHIDNTFPEITNYSYIISTILFLICLPGLVGNGIVIWLLGFRIKRTPFTTYVLNLAIADFAVLNNQIIVDIIYLNLLSVYFNNFNYEIFMFSFTTSQYLMTIISIDRCVCLFFPLWYRCHRPPHLSTCVCVIVWIFSLLITAINLSTGYGIITYLRFVLNAVVCMPIMCVSTTAIFIKFRLRPAQKKGKLLRTIWLTLFFFLLLAFPLNIIQVLCLFHHPTEYSHEYGYLCVFLNSAINPMIYYLVGRDKRGRSSKQIKKVFERLFKEEEDCRENQEI
nr:mas-related G-protein coupled receptor member H-like [Anolis sagrei ordinatus]